MREIKFRAWDKVNKKYIYTGLDYTSIILFELDYSKASPDDYVPMGYTTKQELERFDVEQYTGLKDKNGVEIYEGDLVKEYWQKEPSIIVYFNGAYGFFDSYNNFHYLWITNELVSIVGNIHDKEE